MAYQALLAGKSGIVLGANRGIGEFIARQIVAEGGQVMLAGRNIEALDALAKEIDPSGEKTASVKFDMADADSIEAAIAQTVSRFGSLDLAINNAGIQIARTPINELSDDLFDKVISINLRGVFIAMKHQARVMVTQASGAIINIASAAGIVGIPFISPYAASKHGVMGLTKAAALELAPRNIRVNAIIPGVIKTEMLDIGIASSPESMERALQATPMGRLGTPLEVANAAIWLASDRASFITGAGLTVDGGFTTH